MPFFEVFLHRLLKLRHVVLEFLLFLKRLFLKLLDLFLQFFALLKVLAGLFHFLFHEVLLLFLLAQESRVLLFEL